MKKSGFGLAALGLAALVVSCATAIPVTMRKPPLFDMTGVTKVVILPFGASRDTAPRDMLQAAFSRLGGGYYMLTELEQQAATALTGRMTRAVVDCGAYTVINSADVILDLAGGKPLKSIADAVVTGEITKVSIVDRPGFDTIPQIDGSLLKKPWIERQAQIEFVYRVLRTSDGAVLGERRKSGQASDKAWGEDARRLAKTPQTLIDEIIAPRLGGLTREIAPYITRELRFLETDKSGDPAMRAADSLVRQDRYIDALKIYEMVYDSQGNFAAGFNAAVLTETVGDGEKAVAMMEELAARSGNPKAVTEAERMRERLADAKRLSR
jgi:hypothetical protein